MRVLVLSFYYPPDLCAGSFRAGAIVKALQPRLPPASTIDVLTTLPNRYSSYTSEAPAEEALGGLRIQRIALPRHRSDMLGQSRAFLHFAAGALRRVRGQRYDVVFATSSRLLTGTLGAWIARRVRAPLYLDLRDIFADTMREVLPRAPAALLAPLLAALEAWTVRRAARVNLVSEGFRAYFAERYPAAALSFFTNGIDDEFLAPPKPASAAHGSLPTVLYAGNVGEGQGLHAILPELAVRLRERARFQVIGDGGRLSALKRAAQERGADIEFAAPMDRERLVARYAAADVLFLHLNDYDAFRKVLPSKIFEYAATGKPIWAGVAGHAAEFLAREVSNAAVFPPCDVEAAVASFGALALRATARESFVARYRRDAIAGRLADDVVALACASS